MVDLIENKQDILKVIVFDHLIYNSDRNKGNLIFCFKKKKSVWFVERPDGYSFSGRMKQTVKYYRSDAINGEPGTIKKSAVAKSIIFYKKNKGFPEKSWKTSQKEEVDQQGNLILYGILLRCAEFWKIRKIGMFFHMDIMTAEEKGYVFLFNNSQILKCIRQIFRPNFSGTCF